MNWLLRVKIAVIKLDKVIDNLVIVTIKNV